ncbi:MAG: QueT transporter family protein [Oscillospiraceae bacterium]|nr:QueT transporter family protein [Oscillospiraceae bacterium]
MTDGTTRIRRLALSGVIAALYAALTIGTVFISFGPLQFRVAEALTVLPFFFPHSVWGVFVGVVVSNIFSPYGPLDIVIGSLATLIAALCTMRIGIINRDSFKLKVLACLPPVIINAIAIGALIAWAYAGGGAAFWPAFVAFGLQVGLGQLGVLYIIGLPILHFLPGTPVYKLITNLYDGKSVRL